MPTTRTRKISQHFQYPRLSITTSKTIVHDTFKSTVHPRLTDQTAPPSLGDASTEPKGCFPSRTTDARNLSRVTSTTPTACDTPSSPSPSPVPFSPGLSNAGFSLVSEVPDFLAPVASAATDCACDAVKRFHTFTAAGHKGAAVTRDSKRASAASEGSGSSTGAASEARGFESDAVEVGAEFRGQPSRVSGGVVGSPMSRLVACATRANKPFVCGAFQQVYR